MTADVDVPIGDMSGIAIGQQHPTQPGETQGADPLLAEDPPDHAESAEDDEMPAALSDRDDEAPTPPRRRLSPVRLAAVTGLVVVVVVGAVAGWLGFQAYQARQDQQQRELYLRVGRQGAVNLTTLDWQNIDSDVQRILDLATGTFYDDFSKRAQLFADVVKKAQSKSVGTVTEAGLESVSGNEAQVLVAVSVKTSNLGAAEQAPRAWRMRIDVERTDGGPKVSNVVFVP